MKEGRHAALRTHTRALVRDALLAALLICSKELLAFLPNVELVSMLIMVYTVIYRFRALVPIYVFVALEAVLYPSPSTTLMYLYVWALLWGACMLLPRRILPAPVYMVVGGLFGLLFGVLCAPVQAFWFGLDLTGTIAWVVAGFPFDCIHAVSCVATGMLVPSVCGVLERLERR